MSTTTSVFDYDGIVRESYEKAGSLATETCCVMSQQQRSTLAALGVGTLCFLTASMVKDGGGLLMLKSKKKAKTVTITSAKEVMQYGVGRAVVTCLTRFLWTPRVTEVRVTQSILKSIPQGIGNLTMITAIDVSGNHITTLPKELGRLHRLETLDVSNNCLVELPSTLGSLSSLVSLNAMGNAIASLDGVYLPGSLRILGLKDNCLREFPKDFFTNLVNLEQLYLTGNRLVTLPESLCDSCHSLVKLQASHNALTSLPERLGSLHALELLRVACCEIAEVPESMMHAPSLTWLSLAGNPCCGTRLSQVKNGTRVIHEKDLFMGKKLGDGASGEVFEAEYKKRKVAYKIFRKDQVSPDGHCQDEIQIACMMHDENLAKVLARVDGGDAPVHGLIMEFVDGSPLAEKPNGESLLRCRWAPGRLFSISFVLQCLSSVSGALQYMHSRCIAHGDVYAHNILATEDGRSILCDYGASFPYTRNNKNNKMFELQEVRAFGILVKDLIERIDISFLDMEVAIDCQKQLLMIAQQCLSIHPQRRPTFADLHRKIKTLEKAAASSGRTPRSDSRFWLKRHSPIPISDRGSQTVR